MKNLLNEIRVVPFCFEIEAEHWLNNIQRFYIFVTVCDKHLCVLFEFLQGVSRACYAEPCIISYGRNVRQVRPSHAGTESKRRKLGSRNLHRRLVQGSSLAGKKFIQKFERVHPEQGRQIGVAQEKFTIFSQ